MNDPSWLTVLGVGIVVFASTNIDDIFLLSAFFADRHLAPRQILIGQFLGIGMLVAASALAALAALAVPEGWIALLGIVPLTLGVRKLLVLRRHAAMSASDADEGALQDQEHGLEQRTRSQILSVAGVTMANGGDNLGVYIPLFASEVGTILLYAAIFAVMTGVWCALGYMFVNNPLAGSHIRRYGHLALPFVLIGLGVYILAGAMVLFS